MKEKFIPEKKTGPLSAFPKVFLYQNQKTFTTFLLTKTFFDNKNYRISEQKYSTIMEKSSALFSLGGEPI